MNRSMRPSSKLIEFLLLATLGLVGISGMFVIAAYFVGQDDDRTLAMEHPLQVGLQEMAEIQSAPEDLIIAAHNAAKARAEEMAREKTAELTAGLPIPPGMKLPF